MPDPGGMGGNGTHPHGLKECDEGVLEWISREKMKMLPQWEGDKIFLRLLEEGAPFFSLKLCYEGDRLTYAALNGKELTQ